MNNDQLNPINYGGEAPKESLVYYSDFGDILIEKIDEIIEDNRGQQFCCHCPSKGQEKTCGCVNRKSRRDGTQENFMSAGLLTLEEASVALLWATIKAIRALEERSFHCACPSPLDREKELKLKQAQNIADHNAFFASLDRKN